MSKLPSKSSGSGGTASLLLRVTTPDGGHTEYYLANGLTIGRTVDNAIELEWDDTVDRRHARVEFLIDGTARLSCVGTGNHIVAGDTQLDELALAAGVKFRVGATDFECVPGQRELSDNRVSRDSACPFCGTTQLPEQRNEVCSCIGCQQSIIPFSFENKVPSLLVVPTQYGGRFRAERFVARGGMGVVLQGIDEEGDCKVAIKLPLTSRGISRKAAKRFKQEIVMLKRVRHQNVVKLLNYGKAGRFKFLVMEWIEGRSLHEVISGCRDKAELPHFDQAFDWFKQACKGLAAIHAVGVVHRDIKPSNILLDHDDRRAYIADLGIGKRIDQTKTVLTMTGEVPGSYQYMAPEQFTAPDTLDERSDIYSLGVTFYELLTGERPSGGWEPASSINKTVPESFDRVLLKLLARRPEDRLRDLHEVLAAIAHPIPEPVYGNRTEGDVAEKPIQGTTLLQNGGVSPTFDAATIDGPPKAESGSERTNKVRHEQKEEAGGCLIFTAGVCGLVIGGITYGFWGAIAFLFLFWFIASVIFMIFDEQLGQIAQFVTQGIGNPGGPSETAPGPAMRVKNERDVEVDEEVQMARRWLSMLIGLCGLIIVGIIVARVVRGE